MVHFAICQGLFFIYQSLKGTKEINLDRHICNFQFNMGSDFLHNICLRAFSGFLRKAVKMSQNRRLFNRWASENMSIEMCKLCTRQVNLKV